MKNKDKKLTQGRLLSYKTKTLKDFYCLLNEIQGQKVAAMHCGGIYHCSVWCIYNIK